MVRVTEIPKRFDLGVGQLVQSSSRGRSGGSSHQLRGRSLVDWDPSKGPLTYLPPRGLTPPSYLLRVSQSPPRGPLTPSHPPTGLSCVSVVYNLTFRVHSPDSLRPVMTAASLVRTSLPTSVYSPGLRHLSVVSEPTVDPLLLLLQSGSSPSSWPLGEEVGRDSEYKPHVPPNGFRVPSYRPLATMRNLR